MSHSHRPSNHRSSSADRDNDRGHDSKSKTINDVLIKALSDAANPGVGDEEPEVMEAPGGESNGQRVERVGSAEQPPVLNASRMKHELESTSDTIHLLDSEPDTSKSGTVQTASLLERSKYIPLRLSYEERKTLRLVNAAINVSDYTNAIDISFQKSARRHHVQLQHIVAFLTGLIAANNYELGQGVLSDRNFLPFEDSIMNMLEIARRYKITNPEKMRSEYGKLVFLMQDAVSANIQPLLGVKVHRPVQTVFALLQAARGTQLLEDPLLPIATAEILPDRGKSRPAIQAEIRRKEKAAEHIVRKYSSSRLSEDTIRLCMYSISDNNSFLNSNRRPVVECIELLHKYFSPTHVDPGYSLAIEEGQEGARLSHSHERQFHYVLQSLTLWAAILEDMFRLWYLAEQDLLSTEQPYELRNTGQGLQRVQQSPRVFRAMHDILARTQRTYYGCDDIDDKKQVGVNGDEGGGLGSDGVLGWVGTSVIHLGDHNVPNALIFIDKYTQVSRILGPLIICLRNLESACNESEGLQRYLLAYGGIEKATKDCLHDFFTHAFDGSGGDNFFDAGSCIDGRLTSAWNWCSQLAQKPYYPLFRLTGFLSFDGEFDK